MVSNYMFVILMTTLINLMFLNNCIIRRYKNRILNSYVFLAVVMFVIKVIFIEKFHLFS